jgi:hypothetical protein
VFKTAKISTTVFKTAKISTTVFTTAEISTSVHNGEDIYNSVHNAFLEYTSSSTNIAKRFKTQIIEKLTNGPRITKSAKDTYPRRRFDL